MTGDSFCPAGFTKLGDFLDKEADSLNRGIPAEFEIEELVNLGFEKVDMVRHLSEVGIVVSAGDDLDPGSYAATLPAWRLYTQCDNTNVKLMIVSESEPILSPLGKGSHQGQSNR